VRSVEEWIGKTDDTPVPPRVKLRVFEKYEGRCYLSGRKIVPGDEWDAEHMIAIINGGQNRESNLAPALKAPHKVKTKSDLAEKSKVASVRKKHLGLVKSKRTMGGKNFRGEPIYPRDR
jgi:5-methylcytosine-specific restriction protein A